MKPSEQCVNLETARKLKETGFPQDSHFRFHGAENIPTEWRGSFAYTLAAPTLAELLRELGGIRAAYEAYLVRCQEEEYPPDFLDCIATAEDAGRLWLELKRQEVPV